MFSIEVLADKIALRLTHSLQQDQEKQEVMAYGIACFLQIFFAILFVILFGLLFHVLIEALIINFSISILRKYSGGAHAGTPGKCLIIGTVISVVPAIIFAHLAMNIWVITSLGVIIFAWAFYEVITKAPVDSIKKTDYECE